MRREALQYVACPGCRERLALGAGELREEGGHILEGQLQCARCHSQYPIVHGVPVLLPSDVSAAKLRTAARFAEEWTRWSDLRDYYEREFLDWIAPLTPADFSGQTVLEGGCGKGRHTALAASYGVKAVVAIDLGESALVAFAHTRHLANAHVIIGDLMSPPVQPVFDLAFSVGVLHHLPDPAAAFASLAAQVREGGRVAFWVYGQEGNEWITRYVDPVRNVVTSKLPAGLLRALCVPPSFVLWAVIKLFYRPGADGRGRRHLPYGDYFAALHAYPFDEVHANVFDQLVTPVAFYLREAEVRTWFDTGFRDTLLRSHRGYSWTGLATVKREAAKRAETGE